MTDVLAKQEQINDPAGGKRIFCPLNTVIKNTIAYGDQVTIKPLTVIRIPFQIE